LITQLLIAVTIGAVGSYLSFFKPALLSKNIVPLDSSILKWIASFISLVALSLLIVYVDPKTNEEWIEFSFLSVFYFIAVTDLYSKIIPNRLVLVLLGITLLQLAQQFEFEFLLAGGVIFLILTTSNLLTNKFFKKNLFGWGDVKLIAVLGLFTGWEVLWIMYIAIILGGLLSIVGLFAKKINRTTQIPLAFFLYLGVLIMY